MKWSDDFYLTKENKKLCTKTKWYVIIQCNLKTKPKLIQTKNNTRKKNTAVF